VQRSPIPEAATEKVEGRAPAGTVACRRGRALWGWSPPPLPADTAFKRLVDRVQPRTGVPALAFFAAVVVLLNVGQFLPRRADLATVGLAAVAAGGWCTLNFWRCRQAHCALTGAGWLALAVFTFAEATVGRSVIGGDEALVFLVVLGMGLVFETGWHVRRGTNSLGPGRRRCWPANRSVPSD
jgi:hypothetical protein